MIAFEEGYQKIIALARPMEAEAVSLDQALGRVLADDVTAKRFQPATDISAMDGYVLAGDAASYIVISEIAAGANELPILSHSQAARIFTGAPIPSGADRILIQENATRDGDNVVPTKLPNIGQHIRRKGLDFGPDFTVRGPLLIGATQISLLASMNLGKVSVHKRPKIAVLSTGNELVIPGEATTDHDVIASNAFGIAALARAHGADADILPLLPDDLEQITSAITALKSYDIIVTTGGASVGDYDYTARAAAAAGFELTVQKIAMRPGKPVLAGKSDDTVFLGLPGNPVSALMTAKIFLVGLIKTMLGFNAVLPTRLRARAGIDLPENADRLHFMRSDLVIKDGDPTITPHSSQDSAFLSGFSSANAYLLREPYADAVKQGDWIEYIDAD